MRTLVEIVTEAEKMLVEFEAKWREVLTEGAAVMQAESHAAGRAEGRREALLEALRVLDDYFHSGHDCPYCHRGDAVAGAQSDIRKLIEAEKGGGA